MFDTFYEYGNETEYTLSSCAGVVTNSERRASGYQVQSLDGSISLSLPTLIECNQIPENREEIPTPNAARYHSHLKDLAITADIEQMFYGFKVRPDHRDFLRFLWYKNNDPTDVLIDYRMTAHVLGNSPSPAVAVYGLRKSVEAVEGDMKIS